MCVARSAMRCHLLLQQNVRLLARMKKNDNDNRRQDKTKYIWNKCCNQHAVEEAHIIILQTVRASQKKSNETTVLCCAFVYEFGFSQRNGNAFNRLQLCGLHAFFVPRYRGNECNFCQFQCIRELYDSEKSETFKQTNDKKKLFRWIKQNVPCTLRRKKARIMRWKMVIPVAEYDAIGFSVMVYVYTLLLLLFRRYIPAPTLWPQNRFQVALLKNYLLGAFVELNIFFVLTVWKCRKISENWIFVRAVWAASIIWVC